MLEFRKKINEIDRKILELLAERRKTSGEVVKYKQQSSLPIRDHKREEELLKTLIKIGRECGLEPDYVSKIFYEIIDDSVKIQQNYIHSGREQKRVSQDIVVSVAGHERGLSELAARKYFKVLADNMNIINHESIESTVDDVISGRSDHALLPIEYSSAGGVNEVIDIFYRNDLYITGEEKFDINYCLAGPGGVSLNDLEAIVTDSTGASVCSKFISTMPDLEVKIFSNRHKAFVNLVKESLGKSLLASEAECLAFGLSIIRDNISNHPGNFARYFIVSSEPVEVDRRIPAKTSIILSIPHKAGTLAEALMLFKDSGINITKIHSRPVLRDKWEELFLIEFEGNLADPKTAEVLDQLKKKAEFLKAPGSYPSADLFRTRLSNRDAL